MNSEASNNLDIIFDRVKTGQFNEAIALIHEELGLKPKGILSRIWLLSRFQSIHPNRITLHVLLSILKESKVGEEYVIKHPIDFDSNYVVDIQSLFAVLFIINDSDRLKIFALPLADFIYNLLDKCANHIAANSNGYPQNSINGKIWMDGAVLSEYANELACFYRKQGEDNKELLALTKCGMITMAIMSHYHHIVGHAMISIADWYIRHNDVQNANKYYVPVIKDFEWLINEMNDLPAEEIPGEYFTTINWLKKAYEGIENTEAARNFPEIRAKIEMIDQIMKKQVFE